MHLTTITDPDGRVRVTNTYDSQSRVYPQRDGKNALTTIAYTAPTAGPDPTPYRAQTSAVGGIDTSSISVNKPAGVVDGDLLIAFVETQGLNEYKAISPPAGWTRAGAPAQELEGDVREAEGLGDRGDAQRRLAAAIEDRRARRLPPPRPCDPAAARDPDRWNAPRDAHHKQPLFLGGVDAPSNLCALEAHLHQIGHPRLDRQDEWTDVYMQCGIRSAKLTLHPAFQEYYIAASK